MEAVDQTVSLVVRLLAAILAVGQIAQCAVGLTVEIAVAGRIVAPVAAVARRLMIAVRTATAAARHHSL